MGENEAYNFNYQRLISSESYRTDLINTGTGIFDFVTPINSIVLIDSAILELLSAAVPGARRVTALCVDFYGQFIWATQASVDQPAGQNVLHSFVRGGNTDIIFGTFITCRLPDIFLHDGQTFRLWCTGLQAGDHAQNVLLQYKILRLNRP
jgi:hypothetical protein